MTLLMSYEIIISKVREQLVVENVSALIAVASSLQFLLCYTSLVN